jgi:hypothetical protein
MKAAAKGKAKNRGMNVTLASLSFQLSDLCNVKGLISIVDTQHNTQHEGGRPQRNYDCGKDQGLRNGIDERMWHIDLFNDWREHAAPKPDQREEEVYCVFNKSETDHDLDQVTFGNNRV